MPSEYSDDLFTSEYTDVLPHTHLGDFVIDPDLEFLRNVFNADAE